MKKIITMLILVFLVFTLIGCDVINKDPLNNKKEYVPVVRDVQINYHILETKKNIDVSDIEYIVIKDMLNILTQDKVLKNIDLIQNNNSKGFYYVIMDNKILPVFVIL